MRLERLTSKRNLQFLCSLFAYAFSRFYAYSEYDLLYFRNGNAITGEIHALTDKGYYFKETDFTVKTISKDDVGWVVYGNQNMADQQLQLSQLGNHYDTNSFGAITLLPAEDFGRKIIELAEQAQQSIWVSTYLISGSESDSVRPFFDLLVKKAKAGLDIRLMCEFGYGTQPSIKSGTLNLAKQFEAAGVSVKFVQEYKTLHKKLIIFDEKKIILGSSNLTKNGTLLNDEMNVLVDIVSIVQAAILDFDFLYKKAKSYSELTFK